jgi:hypothetical protein
MRALLAIFWLLKIGTGNIDFLAALLRKISVRENKAQKSMRRFSFVGQQLR